MSIEVTSIHETHDGNVLSARVKVPNEERARLVGEALQGLAREAGVDVSKAGDIRAELTKRIGEDRLTQSVTAFVSSAVAGTAVTSSNVKTMFEPEFKRGSIQEIFDEGDVDIDVEFVLQPSFELSSYEPVKVTVAQQQLNEQLVDSYVQQVLEQHAHWQRPDRPVQAGDFILVNMETKLNGQHEEGLSGQRMSIELAYGKMPDAFVVNVNGMELGQERTFSFTAPRADEPGQEDSFEVQVMLLDARIKVVPELTDRFVCEALSDSGSTVEEFRENVRNILRGRLGVENEQGREAAADAELASRLNVAIPDVLIERMSRDIYTSLRRSFEMQNMSVAQYLEREGLDERKFQMSLMSQARDALRQGCALDALFEHLEMSIEQADIDRALQELAPGRAQEAEPYFKSNGTWSMVLQMAGRLKAHDWLMETAVFE